MTMAPLRVAVASLVVVVTVGCSEPDDPVFDTSALDNIDEVTVLDTELPPGSWTDQAVILDEDQYLAAQLRADLDLPDVDFSESIVVAATLGVGVCHDIIVTDVRADGPRLDLHADTDMIDLPVNTDCPALLSSARIVLEINRAFLTAGIDDVAVHVDGQEQDHGWRGS